MPDTLSEQDRYVYFSSWQYTAIHIALSVPAFQTVEALTKHLSFPPKRVTEILKFLVRSGLAIEKKGRFEPGHSWIHLEKDSPLATKNHVNWRLQSLRALESQADSDLHYTSGISASKEDVYRIKAILVKAMEEVRAIIAQSTPEQACGLLIDLFDF